MIRTKKEENKEQIKKSGAAKKSRKMSWAGHVYAKGNSELMTHFTTF